MPEGEEMFNYHGYSGPCPKPHLKREEPDDYVAFLCWAGDTPEQRHLKLCNSDTPGAFKVYRGEARERAEGALREAQELIEGALRNGDWERVRRALASLKSSQKTKDSGTA